MNSGVPAISSSKLDNIRTDIESCFEFGRYLVAPCGQLETEVLAELTY